ncbi:MAG: hypothetical protein VXZ96_07985, partial [Myxococcota bacterium]|nr:hypothetical protein [Myxococcota bacterium]
VISFPDGLELDEAGERFKFSEHLQKIGHANLKEFHYDFQMTLLPITENGVEALPINVRFGTEENPAKVEAELPAHPPVKSELGPNKTGVKGNVKVKSEIGFVVGNPHVAESVAKWTNEAHQLSNDEVMFHIAKGLYSGEIPLIGGGQTIRYGMKEGQDELQKRLDGRFEKAGSHMVHSVEINAYSHTFLPKQQDVTPSPDPDPDPPPVTQDPVAANEMARFWGDPHFVGADGGKFDVQGEAGKTYNLLTDKGLKYEGRFDGWGQGVTVVGRTSLVLTAGKHFSTIIFEPKKDLAIMDGKAVSGSMPTADGGETHREGSDLVTTTAEGYRIVQHMRGKGKRRYIDAEVHTGAQGTESDGVAAGGLLGITFDADDKRRDGKKGKGAQGEGAIEGVYTDYEINRRGSSGFNEWFYLATYDDVSAAVQRSEFSSGRQHYDRHGLEEGRSFNFSGASFEFDESFYLANNPDVAAAVAKGDFESGAHHYVLHGRSENRPKNQSGQPSPPAEQVPKLEGGQAAGGSVPAIRPINTDLGPDKTGVKAHVTVTSDINYDVASWDHVDVIDSWVETNHQLSNDSVMYDIVRKLRSGDIKVIGRSMSLSEGDGKKLLKAELEQRLLTPDTQMVTGFVVNNYAHTAEIFSAPQSGGSETGTTTTTGTDSTTALDQVNLGGMGEAVNQPQVIEGETFGPGIWVVRVKEKNAGFKQRVIIDNADKGSGNLPGKPGRKRKVVATKNWTVKIQNDGGKGKWKDSKLRRKDQKNGALIHSEDWTDNDFNDLIVRVRQKGDIEDDAVTAVGGDGRDRINQRGGRGRDVLRALGGRGRDRIFQRGGRGRDSLLARGGRGRDRIRQRGGRGADILKAFGGRGRDRINQRGGRGADILKAFGGRGRDRIRQRGGRGADMLDAFGGSGRDNIKQKGGRGNDTLTADGGKGNDKVKMKGGRGNDTLVYHVSEGNDKAVLRGGRGKDTAIIYTHGHAVTVKGKRGRVLFSSDGERETIVGRSLVKVFGVEKIKYITSFEDGEQQDDEPIIPEGNGVQFEAGSWMVRVTEKNAGFKQRVVIANADQGSGNLKGKPGKTKEVTSTQTWHLNIQNDGGKGKWKDSQIRKSGGKGKFVLNSEDWTDNDFNDLIVEVQRVQESIPPLPQDPPPPEAPGPPHPNIGMAGTVAFESEADFTVAQGTSNAENVAGMFKTSHEESNKATLYGIVERVRSGEIERTDSGIKYTDKQAEDELKIDLNKRKPKSIESYKFTEAKLTSDIKAQFKSDHVTTAQVQGEIKPPPGSNTKALSAMVKIVASGSQTSDDISQPDAMLQLGKSLQQSATDAQAHAVMEEIKSGELPFVNGIVLDEAKILQELFGRLTAELAAKDMKLKSLTTQEVTAVVDFTAVDEQTMKVWEVLFDVRSGPTSGGNRIDPLIFDLNMDGKFDITGKNQ